MAASNDNPAAAEDAIPKRTPLILLWAFTTLIWSIFTPPQYTFVARVLIFQPLWAVRMYLDDSTWVQDLLLFLCLHAGYSHWIGAWRFLGARDFGWVNFSDPVFLTYLEVFSLLGICGVFAGSIVYRGHQLRSSEPEGHLFEQSIDEQLLPPLLIASRTQHSRIFPKTHSFAYSYLFVGIPVGIQGRISKALSVESRRRSWFHVDAADYLARGSSHLGLGEKLKRYLHTQGVTDREYSFAYLVTAPRFLGYSFNPVSFWYLYDSDTKLKFMILEVNNTFDERRMYLLRTDDSKQEPFADGAADGFPSHSKTFVMTDPWQKDFHVSPFNSREGSYTLRAIDPLAALEETGQVCIKNTIVLRSSKEHAKIVAKVSSEGPPVNATTISTFSLAKFIAGWWWVGLLTFPRIVWEAQKLFFRKRLHVWYRPEIADTSIGRTYTEDEQSLENFFRVWLAHVVEHALKPLRVIYEPVHHDGEEIVLYSPGFTYEEAQKRTLTLKALSPAFYSRFVHYAHTKEAFDRECLATNEKNRTLSIENADLLPDLLQAMRPDSRESSSRQSKLSIFQEWRWTVLKSLRCPPPASSYPSSSQQQQGNDYDISDIRTFSSSELDEFIRARVADTSLYRRTCCKLFLAERFGLGIPIVIELLDRTLRAFLLVATMVYCRDLDAGDVLRPKRLGVSDFGLFAGGVLLANSVHVWSLVKG